MQVVQARLGTALFASGAFNTWRTPIIVDILFRHDTMHNGDDLQQGLLLHSLGGKPQFLRPDLLHAGNYKVEVSDILISTDVPVHWAHWRDLYPSWMPRKWAPKVRRSTLTLVIVDARLGSSLRARVVCAWKISLQSCNCGEPSLFHQRAKGWDVSRHRFFFKYLKMVISWRTFTYRGLCARAFALHDMALILNDWVSLIYTIVIFVIMEERILIFHGLIGAWAFQVRFAAVSITCVCSAVD